MHDPQHAPPTKLVIGPDHRGDRLDRVVSQWRGLSRAAVLRLLDGSAVRHNGRPVVRRDKGMLLHDGDVLEIDPAFAQGESPLADASVPLVVLAQGAGWLVVDKPAGVAVRPHAISERGTVLSAVVAHYPQIIGVGEGGLRCGVVHRLDNETSGTLLIATTQEHWLRFRLAFAEHRVRKRYLALVHGRPDDEGQAVMHLRVARHAPAHVEVCDADEADQDARACSLAWHVIDRLGLAGSLIEVDLHTGFLHQVRVMMSELGHPVVGDDQYGPGRPHYGATRQMLHAATLDIDEVSVRSPLPVDMQQTSEHMRAIRS